MRYQEIKKQLIEIIGTMDPGTRLPSRPIMCKQLDTTRTTLDRAIKELESEGVLSSRNGSGTYVVGLIAGTAPHIENWCIIVPNVMDDIYPSLIRGIENVASSRGANLVLCNSDNDADKQDRYIKRLLVSGVAGFIIVPVVSGSAAMSYKLYDTLLDSKTPFVFCNRGVEGIQAPLVKSNDFYGGYIATKHLIQKGYRNIAYIAQMKYQTSTERCQGYISALLEQDIEINRRLIILSRGDDSRSTYDVAKQLIAEEPHLDAVFCFNDYVAHDVCRAIQDCGLRVSDDIGVIGYDNIAANTSVTPQLTSVAYKSMEIGEAAANVLSDLIQGKPTSTNFNFYLFQPSIVERESCCGRPTATRSK